jgi:hypothetical protein
MTVDLTLRSGDLLESDKGALDRSASGWMMAHGLPAHELRGPLWDEAIDWVVEDAGIPYGLRPEAREWAYACLRAKRIIWHQW